MHIPANEDNQRAWRGGQDTGASAGRLMRTIRLGRVKEDFFFFFFFRRKRRGNEDAEEEVL